MALTPPMSPENRAAAQRVATRFIATKNVIDEAWIARVRKSWKTLTQKRIGGEAFEQRARLTEIIDWLDEFGEDIMFAKGFWVSGVSLSIVGRAKAKVLALLKETRDLLVDERDRSSSTELVMDPKNHEYKMDGGRIYQFYADRDPRSPMRAFNLSMAESANEVVEKADGVFSRKLLRALTSFITEFGQNGSTGDVLESYDRVTMLGRVKLVFQDLPFNPRQGPLSTLPQPGTQVRDPYDSKLYVRYLLQAKALLERAGFGFLWYGTFYVLPKDAGGENELGKNFGVGARYFSDEDAVKIFANPTAFLSELITHELGHRYYYKFMSSTDRERFDSAFAGRVTGEELKDLHKEIRRWAEDLLVDVSEGKGPPNVDGDALLLEFTDLMSDQAQRRPAVIQDFARKWQRLMPPELREKLTKFMEGVAGTSVYGQQSSAEDFAEVFAAYVTGNSNSVGISLSREQVERLKTFFDRTKKHGSAARVAARFQRSEG